jgi:tetratricopeptide (TPR) repeat protein
LPEYEAKMNEAIEADPHFFMAHAYRALSEASDKESDSVKIYFDQALALPQDQLTPAEQTIRQIIVKLDEEKPDEIRPLLDQLVTTYPENPQAYEIASDISMFILGDPEESFAYTKKLVEVDPNHASAYNTIGYYHLDKKEMDKAKEAFDKYLSLAPEEPNAHDSMGDYYMAVAEYDKSAEHYNKAVAMGMEVSKVKADKATAMADDEEEDPNVDFDTDTPDDEQDRDTLDSDIK